jgi:hypothetical protein
VLVTPTTLRVDPKFSITSGDIIVVKHISELSRSVDLEYRIFKGITETYEYFGIGNSNTTALSRELLIDDEWLYVEDIDVLSKPDPVNAKPGVVFIGSERITFYIEDFLNKRLGQLRRATNGTGAPAVHALGTKVYDAAYKSEIPLARDSYIVSEGNSILVGKAGQQVTVSAGDLIRQGHLWQDVGAGSATNGLGLSAATSVQANFLKAL